MGIRRISGMVGGAAGVALLVIMLPGCGPDPIVTPVRNLERPSDMDFVCMSAPTGTGTARVTSARPMAVCKDPVGPDPAVLDASTRVRTLGTFGLVTNSARAEVGAIDLEAQRLIDLDPAIPGFNQIPVGALPESIATSDDGCRAVTANRGSCDLSIINTSRMLAPVMGGTAPTQDMAPLVTTLRVKTASGRELRSAPFEVTFVPALSATQPYARQAPLPDSMPPQSVGVLGPMCGDPERQSWRAVVTFPSCDLVALVAFPDGKIISSVKVLPDGQVVNAGTDPVCPSDCGAPTDGGAGDSPPPLAPADAAGGDVSSPPVVDAGATEAPAGDSAGPDTSPDAGAPDDGGAGSVGASSLGVGAMAIMPTGDRLYVAASRSDRISAVGIAPGPAGGFLAVSEPPVPLSEQAGGVTRLRLSYNRFGPPKPGGPFVGKRGQFLYAFARDGSVRVVEIGDGSGRLLANPGECDVNVDPDRPGFNAGRPCYRVTENFPRLLLEKGPGLRVPVRFDPDVAAPTPIDIAFSDLGEFGLGMLLASNGRIYQVMVDLPVSLGEAAHTPRRSSSTPGGSGGDPRIETPPVRDFSVTPVAFPTKVGFASDLEGPRLESYAITVSGGGSKVTNWMKFQPRSTVRQGVQIRWEGILPGTSRLTGRLGPSGAGTASTVLRDVGADFCRYSVEPGDVLGFTGCEEDRNCQANFDEVCYRVAPGAQGTCLPRSFVANEPLVASCRAELASRRRYEILEVRKRQLVLGLKMDEVPRPALAPCTPGTPSGATNVCQPDAAHGPDPTIVGDQGFQCLELKAGEPRCLKACGVRDPATGRWQPSDERCRPGHVCADVGNEALGPLCVEGPLPRLECTPRDAPYRVQAGNSYLVRSDSIPHFVIHREAPLAPGEDPGAGGLCQRDPSVPKLFSQRISLKAPHCQTVMDGARAATLEGVEQAIARNLEDEPVGANACLFRGPNENEPDPAPPAASPTTHVKGLFQNPHYRFILTNLEAYPGDAATVNVTIMGGFSPLTVASTGGTVIGLGARIVTSPSDADERGTSAIVDGSGNAAIPPPFFFVVDQGRTLTQFSRGQVVRVNPRPLPNVEGGFLDSIDTDTLFPIQ